MGDLPIPGVAIVETPESPDVIRMRDLTAELTALLTQYNAKLVVTNPRLSVQSMSPTANDKQKEADAITALKKIGQICTKYQVVIKINPDIELRMTPTKEGDKCEQLNPANQ